MNRIVAQKHPVLEAIESPEAVADELERQTASARLTHRLAFLVTWGFLAALLVGGLFWAGKLQLSFLDKWYLYILGGVPITIFVTIVSIVLALVLAVLGALGRLSQSAFINAIASFYVSFVRGTPLIVQILFVFLALPQVWDGFARVPAIVLGILALGFNYGAYTTEIIRAGIEAVPRGQREAAAALAMPSGLILRRVVAPQAIRIVTPALGNQFISMTKDSALVSVIAVQELLWRAKTVGQSNFRSLETLLLAATVYWAITIALTALQGALERRMAQSDAGHH